ncbi:uncharacterized protein PHA67_015269 isoform 2-T2 [Liasis olivaceus]
MASGKQSLENEQAARPLTSGAEWLDRHVFVRGASGQGAPPKLRCGGGGGGSGSSKRLSLCCRSSFCRSYTILQPSHSVVSVTNHSEITTEMQHLPTSFTHTLT